VEVAVRLPSALPAVSPGFCTFLSDAVMEPGVDGYVRVYWNVARRWAPSLVRCLTERLNGRGVPFRLKVADHRAGFDRCDAAVLYVGAAAFRDQAETVRRVAEELAAGLRGAVPAFTLPVAPGVALAESDGKGDSFGTRRCAWLADGMVRSHDRGAGGDD